MPPLNWKPAPDQRCCGTCRFLADLTDEYGPRCSIGEKPWIGALSWGSACPLWERKAEEAA